MLRVTLESILGLEPSEGHVLRLRPCIPDDWPGFRLRYRLPDGGATYDIEVRNPDRNAQRVAAVEIDGRIGEIERGAALIPLFRDGGPHRVAVTLSGSVEKNSAGFDPPLLATTPSPLTGEHT